MLRFLPKYEDFWLLFSKVNIKKSSTHGWTQQWLCFILNWMDYPKYHRFFWLISWLSHKSPPKTKLSTTGTLSTIGKLPYALQKRSWKIWKFLGKISLFLNSFCQINVLNGLKCIHLPTVSDEVFKNSNFNVLPMFTYWWCIVWSTFSWKSSFYIALIEVYYVYLEKKIRMPLNKF